MNKFFIIGAQRCGTSYLYKLLNEHTEIQMLAPLRPEAKILLNEKYKNITSYDYDNLFSNIVNKSTKIIGEKATSYIEMDRALKQISINFPNSKIIIMLRDPVMRAFSNYKFTLENGLEKESFEKALELETNRLHNNIDKISVNPYAYFARGVYNKYIENCYSIFSRCNIKIVIYEELINNLLEIQKIYQWLEVDESFIPKKLQRVVNSTNVKVNFSYEKKIELFLKYEHSIAELEKLLGRDLSIWQKKYTKV
jgi:hypothetical protein